MTEGNVDPEMRSVPAKSQAEFKFVYTSIPEESAVMDRTRTKVGENRTVGEMSQEEIDEMARYPQRSELLQKAKMTLNVLMSRLSGTVTGSAIDYIHTTIDDDIVNGINKAEVEANPKSIYRILDLCSENPDPEGIFSPDPDKRKQIEKELYGVDKADLEEAERMLDSDNSEGEIENNDEYWNYLDKRRQWLNEWEEEFESMYGTKP